MSLLRRIEQGQVPPPSQIERVEGMESLKGKKQEEVLSWLERRDFTILTSDLVDTARDGISITSPSAVIVVNFDKDRTVTNFQLVTDKFLRITKITSGEYNDIRPFDTKGGAARILAVQYNDGVNVIGNTF